MSNDLSPDETSDLQEFVNTSKKYVAPTEPAALAQPTSTKSKKSKEETPEPGSVTQYSLHGPGFRATTTTIPHLEPGCYDITSDNVCVFAIPALKQSGILLELPEMRSEEIIRLSDTFWNSEKDYKEGNEFVIGGAAFKSGIMVYGPPGCHAKGQGILMYDGSVKKVEDIEVGDYLMGPDSQSRKVLELKRGQEEMIKITPVKGDSFVINKSHVLHLTPSGKDVLTQTPINMKFSDWLEQKNNFKERYKLTRSSVEFTTKQLPIEPYMLGMWLGDGTSHITDITTADIEIKNFLQDYADRHSMILKHRESTSKGKASTYGITNGIGQKNPFLTNLQELELIRNKHVPLIYKTSDNEQRLELLAGLIDSDGYMGNGCVDFISKFERLADDVIYLSRSLGFSAYKTVCEKSCQGNFTGTYFRLSISGDMSKIPSKLPRKQGEPRKQTKNVLRTGFTFETLPVDDFYGFTLNKDHLYLTDDFTIHHNSGKSCTLKLVSNKLVTRGGIVFYASTHPTNVMSFLNDFARIENDRKSIVILEDFDSLIKNYGDSAYLAMLDSASSIDNILFIATTNYPERLDPRIYNRPGRFSHVVKIGLPGPKTRDAYLRAILKNHRDVDEIVEKSQGFTIDHLSALINAVYREKKNLQKELARLKILFEPPKVDDRTLGFGLSTETEE